MHSEFLNKFLLFLEPSSIKLHLNETCPAEDYIFEEQFGCATLPNLKFKIGEIAVKTLVKPTSDTEETKRN